MFSQNENSMESSSSEDDFVVLSLMKKKRKRKREYWVHPLLTDRKQLGTFQTTYKKQRLYPDRFKVAFRMTVPQFDDLLAKLEPHIQKKNTNFREAISAEQRLAVCLR